MARATRSQGWLSSRVPRIATSPAPVRASPRPTTTAPPDCIHRRNRTSRFSESTAARRARRANGRRSDGSKRLTASATWTTRRMGKREGGICPRILGAGPRSSRPARGEHHPIALDRPFDDFQAGPGEGGRDLRLAVLEDPGRDEEAARPDLVAEPPGEGHEDGRDQVRDHEVERRLAARERSPAGRGWAG